MTRTCTMVVSLAAVVLAAFQSTGVRAQTVFYVDPDWTGTASGAPDAPFTRLDGAAWTAIDGALATGEVIVYFSARKAQAEENQTTASAVNIERTDTSSNRLTLDGMSFYNADDTAPSWVENTGPHKFQVTARYPMTTGEGTNRDYVTIRGFRIIAGDDGVGGQIIHYWGGSHVVIEHNELSHHPNAGHGAGLQYGYAHHQGSSGNGGCTDIVIRDNVIFDTFGECIYVGGSEDTGLDAHTTVVVENNVTYNCGVLGGEGDCIDIKDGSTDITIRANLCFGNADGSNVNGITSSSPITAEYNVVYDTPGKGITFGTFWGRGYSGVRIAYNLLFGNAKDGIYCGTDTADRPIDDVTIIHNTVVGNAGNGLVVGSGADNAVTNVSVVNNIFTDNGAAGLGGWGDLGGCTASFNDIFNNQNDFAGPFSSCQSVQNNIQQDPQFTNTGDPPGPDRTFRTNDDGYKPLLGSPVCSAGENGADMGALPCGDLPDADGGISVPDGGSGQPDAGTSNGGEGDSGCGCRTPAPTTPDGDPLLPVLLFAAVLFRRRRTAVSGRKNQGARAQSGTQPR